MIFTCMIFRLPSFNDNPSFNFEFSLITPDKTKADFFETSFKIKPKQLFQRIEEMKEKNEPTITYKLFEKYPRIKHDEKPPLSSKAAHDYAIYEAKKVRENLEHRTKCN